MGITLSGRAGTKQKEKVKNTKQKMVLNQALRDDTFLAKTSCGASSQFNGVLKDHFESCTVELERHIGSHVTIGNIIYLIGTPLSSCNMDFMINPSHVSK